MIKNFDEFINESSITETNHDAEELNIMTAAVISILKNYSYEEGPTFQKKLRSINYDDIVDILNDQFGGNYSKDDIKRGNGKIMQVIQKNKSTIEGLVNGKYTSYLNGEEIKSKYANLIKK